MIHLISILIFLLFSKINTEQNIKATVFIIYAYNNKEKKQLEINQRLNEFSSYITEYFGNKYNTFELLDERELFFKTPKEKQSINLPNNKTFSLEFLKKEMGYLRFKAYFPDLTVTLKIYLNGFIIQAGRTYREGIMIFIIKAESFDV